MKKLTIACTLGLFATAPALAVDDMTATAETFTRALLQHDGTAAAALVALPAGGKISREQLAQCISAQSRKFMPNGGEILGSEAQDGNNVLVRVRVNGKESDAALPMTKTSDGWRLDSSIITDMECGDAANILSGTELRPPTCVTAMAFPMTASTSITSNTTTVASVPMCTSAARNTPSSRIPHR